jgi:hypothetical protein
LFKVFRFSRCLLSGALGSVLGGASSVLFLLADSYDLKSLPLFAFLRCLS